MEVNSSLLAFAFLCFKIFHSWAVEFVHQESGGGEDIEDIYWLVSFAVWPELLQIPYEQKGFKFLLTFILLTSSYRWWARAQDTVLAPTCIH